MATNKQIIFGTENKAAPAQPVVAEEKQPQPQPQPHPQPQPQQIVVQQKQKLKSVAKSSNLGVKLTMKKITKSPVTDILPGLQPNQPVQVKGALNIAQQVIPDVNAPLAAEFDPAVKHPAATTNVTIAADTNAMQTKKSVFKPETTHPASLPQQQQPIIPTAEKLKLGNFRERLAKKNQKSKKTNTKTRKTNKGKSGKQGKLSKTSKKEPSKKQSTRMIFN